MGREQQQGGQGEWAGLQRNQPLTTGDWISTDPGSRARVEIGDTGHGMSKEFIRERLFKPFQTTKQAGMGIGAYESFQYIRELGGDISVESELNMGTRISVLLPLFQESRGSDLARREAA